MRQRKLTGSRFRNNRSAVQYWEGYPSGRVEFESPTKLPPQSSPIMAIKGAKGGREESCETSGRDSVPACLDDKNMICQPQVSFVLRYSSAVIYEGIARGFWLELLLHKFQNNLTVAGPFPL